MISANFAIGMVILAQTGIGTMGNVLLLCHNVCSLFRRHRLRPLGQIINHLALANTLILLCGGIPLTMVAFGLKYFLHDVTCKLVFYFHRVAWGNSLSTTCLLGGFQALSINPTNCRWAELKFKSPKHINSPCILSWMFHLLINIIVPMRVSGPKSSRNISVKSNLGYCPHWFINTITESLCLVIFTSVDVICLGLMIWASGYMIFFLYRHQQRVQYIHSTRQSSQMSPKIRATKTILILVSTFVLFYSLSSVFETYAYYFDNPQLRLVKTSVFLASCFPTLSPFLLLKNDPHISGPCLFGKNIEGGGDR
uniref:Vomeronasal type-1 receptor n=1 Tax=Ursus americanus TaxID=9643 RepID=A0A452SXA1_URSAM